MTSNLEIMRKFGSFHSSNIDDQLKAAEAEGYEPYPFPVVIPEFESYREDPNFAKFGSLFKETHFFLDNSYTFLNHGAFGSVLKETMKVSQDLQIYCERQPLRFIDRELFPLIVHSQMQLAKFIGCKPTDIAFVENATMGTNVVLNSLTFDADDTIYYLSLAYGAVKKSLQQIHKKYGVELQQEKVNLPIRSENDILELVENTLKEGTKLAVFDHVPSNMAFIMPVKELVKICHSKNVPVLVDGAHSLGALSLNLLEIGADFYVSNAHKWFCAPKGCAFLYAKPSLQHQITALTVSHGYGYGFHSELTYSGLRDYSPYIALQCCLNFWNALGPEKIRCWIKNLLYEAVDLLLKKWKGSLLAPLEMHGTMCCVSLPPEMYQGRIVQFEHAEVIQNKLYHDHKIEVPVKCVDSKLYTRISCHLYNELNEYEKLADVILSMVNIFD